MLHRGSGGLIGQRKALHRLVCFRLDDFIGRWTRLLIGNIILVQGILTSLCYVNSVFVSSQPFQKERMYFRWENSFSMRVCVCISMLISPW